MEHILKTRPKIPRNKYGYIVGNSTGSNSNINNVASSGFIAAGDGNKELESHLLWGNIFNGTQDISGPLTATGTSQFDKIVVKEGLDSSGNINVEGNVDITGNQQIIGNVSVGGNTVLNKTEIKTNLDVDRDISVGGNTILNETQIKSGLTVADNAIFNSNVTVNNDLIVDNDLTVSGDTTLQDLITNNITNSDTITTKNLEVTGQAHFFELIIDKIKSTGGAAIFTPADGFTIDKVTENPSNMILWWKNTDGEGNARDNMWAVGDQALCMSFNQAKTGTNYNVSNKYYWALVTDVQNNVQLGDDTFNSIAVSKTDKDGTLNPEVGDSIVMLGHRIQPNETVTDLLKQRQSAIYIAAYQGLDNGIKAPFIAQYRGINDFDLASHRQSYFDAAGAKFIGNFEVSPGTSIENYINGLVDSAANGHSPWIGDGSRTDVDGAVSVVGYWYTWSTEKKGYVNSGILAQGTPGKTAFEIYIENGGNLTEKEWLESLVGRTGDSAYDIYVKNGGKLSQKEWLESLDGKQGLSAYDLYKAQGGTLSESEWLNSLKGTPGKSAYQSYIDGGGTLSESDWLKSLIGAQGLSAYEIYLKTTTDNPKMTETQWLESLDGEPGLSAYDIYKAQGGELSLEDWLASLKGEPGTPAHDPYISNGSDGFTAGNWIVWDSTLNSNIGGWKDTGIKATGESGTTYYTWIRYSANADGSSMTATPNSSSQYIGIAYNKTSSTPSTNKADYAWSKFRGEDGIPGGPGPDGKTLYTWIKYADDANGTNMSDNPEGKTYMGIAYNKESQTESTTASDYTWSLIKGTDGHSGTYNEILFKATQTVPTAPSITNDTEIASSGWYKTVPATSTSWSTLTNPIYSISGSGVDGSEKGRQLPGKNIGNNFVSDTITFNCVHSFEKVTIRIEASSETGYDKLYVGEIDKTYTKSTASKAPHSVSGNDSIEVSVTMTQGIHTLMIFYVKDSSVNVGDDCGYWKLMSFQYADIYYSMALASYSMENERWEYGTWSTPAIWNPAGTPGKDGQNGQPGQPGNDAEFIRLYPVLEKAVVGLDKNESLAVKLQYIVQHIKGSTNESVVSGFGLKIKDNRSESAIIAQVTTFSNGLLVYENSAYVTGYHTTLKDAITTLTVELYRLSDQTTVQTTSVPVTFQPGAMFSINQELGEVKAVAQSASSNAETAKTNAASALLTANGLATRVTSTENKLNGAEQSTLLTKITAVEATADGLTSSVSSIKKSLHYNYLPGSSLNGWPNKSLALPSYGYQYNHLINGNVPGSLNGANSCRCYIPANVNSYPNSDTDSGYRYNGLQWGDSSTRENIKLTPGKNYTISCWVKPNVAVSVSNKQVLRIEWFSHQNLMDGDRLSGTDSVTGLPLNGGITYDIIKDGWQFVSFDFTAVKDYHEFYFFVYNSWAMSQVHDITITMPMVSDEGVTEWSPNQLDINYVGGNMLVNTSNFKIAGNLQHVSMDQYYDFPNIPGTIFIKKDGANNGSPYYDMVEWSLNGANGGRIIKPDTDYVFSFWANTWGSETNDLNIFMYYGKKDSTHSGGSSIGIGDMNNNPVFYMDNDMGVTREWSIKASNGYFGDGYSSLSLVSGGEWKRYFVHWKTGPERLSAIQHKNNTQDKNWRFPYEIRVLIRLQNGSGLIACPKLEEGCVPSEYTDRADGFMTNGEVSSLIKQTADDILLQVQDINIKIDNKQIELNGDTKVNGSLTLTDADQGFILNGGSGKTVISPQSIGSFYKFQNIANTISRLYASTSEFGSNTLTNTVIFNFTKTFSIGTVPSGKTVTLSNGAVSFMKTNSSTVISQSSVSVKYKIYQGSTLKNTYSSSATSMATMGTTTISSTDEVKITIEVKMTCLNSYWTTDSNKPIERPIANCNMGIQASVPNDAFTLIGYDGIGLNFGGNGVVYFGQNMCQLQYGSHAIRVDDNGIYKYCGSTSSSNKSHIIDGTTYTDTATSSYMQEYAPLNGYKIRRVTSSGNVYADLSDDYILCRHSSGTVNIMLGHPSNFVGKCIRIKGVDQNVNVYPGTSTSNTTYKIVRSDGSKVNSREQDNNACRSYWSDGTYWYEEYMGW